VVYLFLGCCAVVILLWLLPRLKVIHKRLLKGNDERWKSGVQVVVR
jgi:hypothetical protein